MNVIYLGGTMPTGMQDYLLNNGSRVDFASITFQNALIEGLDYYYGNIKIITEPAVTFYPKSKIKKVNRRLFSHKNNGAESDILIGEINLPAIKHQSKRIRFTKELKESLKDDEENIVIVYGLGSPKLSAVQKCRKKIKKAIVIVPDLPEYMSACKNLLYLLGKAIDRKIIENTLCSFDGVVVLTEKMLEKLPTSNKPYVVVEGLYWPDKEVVPVEKEKNITLLYTGIIEERYGLFDLINAFKMIKDDRYRLWLCGDVNGKELFNQLINRDSRIKYFGRLPMEEIRMMQRQATILVNPRHSNEIFTQYSFPSKTMEYMASGTPTLMCKLPSLPFEYHEHLFFFDNESVEGMSAKIEEVGNLDKEILHKKGLHASQFIIENKNNMFQTHKIVRLIESL